MVTGVFLRLEKYTKSIYRQIIWFLKIWFGFLAVRVTGCEGCICEQPLGKCNLMINPTEMWVASHCSPYGTKCCQVSGNFSKSLFFKKNILIDLFLEREGERHLFVALPTYSFIGWLLYALIKDWTHNLGMLRQYSNQLSYMIRASISLVQLWEWLWIMVATSFTPSQRCFLHPWLGCKNPCWFFFFFSLTDIYSFTWITSTHKIDSLRFLSGKEFRW